MFSVDDALRFVSDVSGSGESHGVRCLQSETYFEGRVLSWTPET